MSSGFGVQGGIGRCYPFWYSFKKCLSEAETVSTCFDFRDDYVECLHHKKEFERLNAIHERKEKLGRLAKQEGMTLDAFLAKHPGGPPASGHH